MLSRLELRDFRSHEHTELSWEKQINYVAGPNGAGKSSLLMALQMALTDRCAVTNKAGSFKEMLCRQGGDGDYTITLDLLPRAEGGDPQQLIKRRTTALGLGATKLGDLQQAIEDTLSVPTSVLEVILGGSLFELDEKQQRNLLMSMAGVDMTPKAVKAYLAEKLASFMDAKLPWDFTHTLTGLVPSEAEPVDSVEKQLEALRRDAKRDRDKLEADLAGLGKLGDLGQIDPTAAADIGARREKDVIELRSQINAEETARGAVNNIVAALEKEADELTKQIVALKLPQDMDAAIKAAKTRASTARTAMDDALAAEQKAKAELAHAQREISKFEQLKGSCPTCGQDVDAAFVKAKVAELQAVVEAEQTRIGVAQEAGAKAKDALTLADKRYSDLKQAQDVLLPRSVKLKSDLKAAESKKPKGAPAVSLADLRSKLEHAELLLADWKTTYGDKIEAARQHIQIKKRLAEAKAKADALEAAVAAIRQFRKDAVAGKLASFEKKLNAGGGLFGMAFAVDPESLTVTLATPHGGLSYRSLSESERVRIDTIIRAVISYVTGLRFVVVDRADVLDQGNKVALLKMLVEAGMRALVLAKVDSREDYQPAAHNKVSWFWVAKDAAGVSRLEHVA